MSPFVFVKVQVIPDEAEQIRQVDDEMPLFML